MDPSDARRPPADPLDAAAYWFARDSGLMSAAERDRVRRLAPRRSRVNALPRNAGHLGADAGRADQSCARCGRRRLAPFLAGPPPALGPGRDACARRRGPGLAGGGSLRRCPRSAPRRGERRRVDLESVLTLNTGTQAEVRYTRSERRVTLPGGEIMLEVSPDASHPFIVDTEIGRVRVTGTRFNVRHDGGQMAVAVESGSVEVIAGPWWNGQRVKLPAGYGVRMAGGGETVRIQPVDVATLTAWRQGKAVFNDTPLAEVAGKSTATARKPSGRARSPACASPASSTWTTPAPSSSPCRPWCR